jgi:hypothetical protein
MLGLNGNVAPGQGVPAVPLEIAKLLEGNASATVGVLQGVKSDVAV